jgi:prepilin-type N-terminal cleavage/methylation domain-containing protein
MMKTFKAKSKKGFTLMEMLIVIAIIAILVAIAIPTFSGALDRARYSADLANARAWYAEQQISLMTEDSYTVPEFDDDDLQLSTGHVYRAGQTEAGDFKVTYNPGTTSYDTVTFGATPDTDLTENAS